MANIYDKSSLVLIPSGTKTGKVYSQKPVSGDGDFTFTRSSAATRVNASGNIEKETQNLLVQSNQFDTTWVMSDVTLASGQAGYDGTNDAWEVTRSTIAYSRLNQSVTQSGLVRHSVYAKAGTLDWVSVGPTGGAEGTWFNVSTGVQGEEGSLIIDSSIESVGNGWYRISVLVNSPSNQFFRIYPADVDGGDDSTTAGTIYIQDAQLEQGLVARDYIETTTTAVEGGITDNVPRLDYTDSSCPALLLEPQRTNLFTYSEYIEGWSTSNTGITLEENAVTSPEGVVNAAKIKEDANNAAHAVRQLTGPTLTSGTDYTFSFFAKKGERSIVALSNTIGASNDANCFFDLENGEVLTNQFNSASIEDYGNGWFRCIVTDTADAADDYDTRIYTATADNQFSHQGVLGSGLYIFGLQLEAGSYATSYIPTYGSSVTRSSEPNGLGKTDLITDGFFSSTELTWFIDINLFEKDAGSSVAPRLVNSSNGNIFIGLNETLGANLNIRHKDGTTATNTSGVSFSENGQRFKICVKISGTTGEAFINGSSMGTFTTLAVSNYDEFENAANNAYNLRQMLMFSTALTDQEAIDLTTI